MRGHIPPPPGIYPGDYTLDGDIAVVGPMARSASDLDLTLDLLAGPQNHQKIAWNLTLPEPRKNSLQDDKIAVWLDDPAFPVDSNVSGSLRKLIDTLEKNGARIEEEKPDIDFARSHEIYTQLLTAVSSAGLPKETFDRAMSEIPNLVETDKGFEAQWVRGTTILHRDWSALNYARLMLRQKWADFFTEFDVLLCPVVPVTAFPHDHGDFFDRKLEVNGEQVPYSDSLLAWAGLTCVAYLPATIAPAGLAENGLPVGVQIVGPYLEDKTSIHLAELLEDITGGFSAPPGFE